MNLFCGHYLDKSPVAMSALANLIFVLLCDLCTLTFDLCSLLQSMLAIEPLYAVTQSCGVIQRPENQQFDRRSHIRRCIQIQKCLLYALDL